MQRTRSVLPPVLGLGALLAVGCGGATPTIPSTTQSEQPAPVATLRDPLAHRDLVQTAMAVYSVTIDPGALAATATLVESRAGQANDDVTELDISGFLKADSFTIASVRRDVSGDLILAYTFAHPFAATTSLAFPGDGANRADLGAPVKVLFLLDAPLAAPTWFPGDGNVVVNTGVVVNPNGYMSPGALLDTSGFNATAFPYQVLVDEALDNRNEISNGADPLGNFDDDPTGTGWQNTNINNAGVNNGWTGLGYLHQGQSATREVHLSASALSGSATTFEIALLAKYAQPKAAQAPKPRLPATLADVTTFGYRAFHGAWDVEDVTYVGESGGYQVDTATTSTLSFEVRDWDALAQETSAGDLSQDADARNVAVGESGAPTVELSAPEVYGATTITLTNQPGSGTGTPGFRLIYTEGVLKGAGSGQTPGPKTGLARVTDPEATLDVSSWHTALGPGMPVTFSPVTLPLPITYATFEVTLDPLTASGDCPSPIPPMVGTNRASWGITTTAYNWTLPPASGGFGDSVSNGPNDIGAFQSSSLRAFIVHRYDTTPTPAFDFWRISPTTPPVATQISNFGTLFQGRLAHDIEADSTNRVFVAVKPPFSSDGDPNEMYGGTSTANPDISWFDYDGSTMATTTNTIVTSPNIPVAMAVDAADNLYYIDRTHILHRLVKATGYIEDTTAPFPLDCTAFIDIQTNRRVCDFAISFHNGAFYFMTVAASAAGSNDSRVTRVDCDGTLYTSVNGTNPASFLGYYSNGGSDIYLDQWTGAGVLTDESDVQIFVANAILSGTNPDYTQLNTDLVVTSTADPVNSLGKIAIVDNILMGKTDYYSGTGYRFNTTPPPGWL